MSKDAITVDNIIYYSSEYVGKLCEIHRKQEVECSIRRLEAERDWLISTGDDENVRDAEGVLVAIELLMGENK